MIDDTTGTEVPQEVVNAGESDADVTADESAPSLSINDLANLRQIVDVASSRGAFKANEFQIVGLTYDRLNAFLVSVTPAPEEADEDAAEAAEDTSEA